MKTFLEAENEEGCKGRTFKRGIGPKPSHQAQDILAIAKEYGLEVNKQKSNIIIFNMENKPENIGGISVGDRIKYLGIIVNDKKNCFQMQKEEMFRKARRLANMTYNVIEKSCSRMLIGKTYWKNVALPSILYG